MDNRRRLSFAALTGLAGLLALSGAFVIPHIATAGTPKAVTAARPASQLVASSTAVPLPVAHYSHMLVDPAHQHLFISSGSSSSSILVTDYAGQTVATIANEPGATGLALSGDGSTVYVALADGDAVSAISASTIAETARYPTGTGTGNYTGELVNANGMCVNDAGYGGTGSKVILWSCTGSSNEPWTYWPKYREYSVSSGGHTYCMNDPGYSTTPGTQQIVWTCPDTANELYTLPH